MTLTPAEIAAMEQAIVRGWPALETAGIDGWLARWSSGGSLRANSVAALAFTGTDIDLTLAKVVHFYRQHGGIPRFTITDIAAPAGLDALLEARGWRRTGDNVAYAKSVGAKTVGGKTVGGKTVGGKTVGGNGAEPAAAADVRIELRALPTADWSQIYLSGLSIDRRPVALKLVEGTPRPRVFFSGVRDRQVIASGLSVLDGELASVQCIATHAAARRTGAATAIVQAIEQHAVANGVRRLYLQTEAANTAALRIYERLGFRLAGRYHTRELRP